MVRPARSPAADAQSTAGGTAPATTASSCGGGRSRPIRPRGLGEKPVLAVRIPARLIAAMDRKLRRAGLTRAELMEGLLSRWVGRAAS